MKHQPKVSIVLCCYNQQEYVQDAVQSVLSQTYENIQLIAIDNASTDGSAAILKKFEKDPRVTLLLHSQNGAVTKRLNEGIKASSGEFISILYADDYYLPKKTEEQVKAFSKLPADFGVVYSPGLRLNTLTGVQWEERCMKSSGFILREMLADALATGFINPISPLAKRECFLRYPFYEEVFIEGEGIFFRMGATYKFHFTPEPLVVMRDHLTNSGKAIKKTKEYIVKHMEIWLSEPDFPNAYRGIAQNYVAQMLRNYGWQSVRLAGDPHWARRCFSESVKMDWHQLFHPRTICGTAISFLPSALMESMNRIGNFLRRGPGIKGFRADNC